LAIGRRGESHATYSSRGSAISAVPGTHSVLLTLTVDLRRCAPHRRSSAGITATGVNPGVGSDEPVISAVTAGAVMPNQEARAARRAVRDIGADKLNHHGRSKRVHVVGVRDAGELTCLTIKMPTSQLGVAPNGGCRGWRAAGVRDFDGLDHSLSEQRV
jgi:hypothetical protein